MRQNEIISANKKPALLRPDFWGPCHDRALGILSNQWQALTILKKEYGENSVVPFADLLAWCYADFLTEPLFINGTPAGANTFFKLGTGRTEYAPAVELTKKGK